MSTNGVPEVLKSKGISEETVKALSSLKSEPGWLTEKRLEAWRSFEGLPMPTLRDEAWRYTDISDVRIEDFLPYSPSPDVKSEEEAMAMVVNGFIEPIAKELPLEYAIELNRLIQLEMEGSVG